MVDNLLIRSILLAPENRMFTLMNVLIMPALVNLLIAYGLANLMFQPEAQIFLWGPSSMVIDLLIGSFMASLVTGMVSVYTTLAACHKGLHLDLTEARRHRPGISLSRHPWLGSLLFALMALLVTGIVLAVFVMTYDEDAISWLSFLWIKSVQALGVSIYASLAGTHLAIHYFLSQRVSREAKAHASE